MAGPLVKTWTNVVTCGSTSSFHNSYLCIVDLQCCFCLQCTAEWISYTCMYPCMCAKLLQSRLTLCNPVECSSPGSSVYGILLARTLEWVAMPSSGRSSWPRDWTCISFGCCMGRWVLYHCCHLGSPYVYVYLFFFHICIGHYKVLRTITYAIQ